MFHSDFTVKVVDVASSSHGVYHGHKAPLLSVALDPKEQFVVGGALCVHFPIEHYLFHHCFYFYHLSISYLFLKLISACLTPIFVFIDFYLFNPHSCL